MPARDSRSQVPTALRTEGSACLDRTLGLVGVVRGGDGILGGLPFGVAPGCELREVAAGRIVHRAVNGDGLAVDVFGAGAHQQHGEVDQFVHLANAAHRIGRT